MITRTGPWGYHLIVDVNDCDIESITNKENITEFAKELVSRIDMKAYGEPTVVDFANDDPTKGGYTLVQLIETSNICAHFVSATGEAFFDVFSCKEFEIEPVIQTITEYFGCSDGGVHAFTRGDWSSLPDSDEA